MSQDGYLGSKANPAVWKRIAFECPPHELLVSPFAGHCGLTRLMEAAPTRVVVDQDPEVIDWWLAKEPGVIPLRADSLLWLEEVALNVMHDLATQLLQADPTLRTRDVVQLLKMDVTGLRSDGRCLVQFDGKPLQCVPATALTLDELLGFLITDLRPLSSALTPTPRGVSGRREWLASTGVGCDDSTRWKLPTRWDWAYWARRLLVYLDPPYVKSTRTDPGSVYRFDFDDSHHVRLIRALGWLPCAVILSGYDSELYRAMLSHWRLVQFNAMTRRGVRTECLYCNHAQPEIAHDARLTANNKRDRQTVSRRRQRLADKVLKMGTADLQYLAQLVAARIDRPQPLLTTLEPSASQPLLTTAAAVVGSDCGVLGSVNLRSPNATSRDPAAGSDSEPRAPRVVAVEADAQDPGTVSMPGRIVIPPAEYSGAGLGQNAAFVNQKAVFVNNPGTVWGPSDISDDPVPGTVSVRGVNSRARSDEVSESAVISQRELPAVSVKRQPEVSVTGPASFSGVSELAVGQVLSLFPGIGLLDMAFESLGFSVVRGPDLIWGGDIRQFDATPLRGKIWGVVGGPPCQDFSKARMIAPTGNGEEMIDQYKRVIRECEPAWWLAENVPCVPDIQLDGYSWQRVPVDLEWFAPVRRRRHIQFGSRVETYLDLRPPQPLPTWRKVHDCVVASRRGGIGWKKKRELMGLPKTWDVPALLRDELSKALGNGVPLPMGKFLAAAVADAFGVFGRSVNLRTERRCACPCKRPLSGKQHHFETNCRKIAETRRKREPTEAP